MQRLEYYVATSIDGKIARSDDSFDCFVNEGEHVTEYLDALKNFDAVVMGRRTYEMGTKHGVHDPYPWLETYVFSTTLPQSQSPNVRIVASDPVEAVRALKARPGRGIYLCGGGQLAGLLLEHGLVDDVVLKLSPVIVGDGVPIFAALGPSTNLALVDSRVHPSGVVLLRYQVKR